MTSCLVNNDYCHLETQGECHKTTVFTQSGLRIYCACYRSSSTVEGWDWDRLVESANIIRDRLANSFIRSEIHWWNLPTNPRSCDWLAHVFLATDWLVKFILLEDCVNRSWTMLVVGTDPNPNLPWTDQVSSGVEKEWSVASSSCQLSRFGRLVTWVDTDRLTDLFRTSRRREKVKFWEW